MSDSEPSEAMEDEASTSAYHLNKSTNQEEPQSDLTHLMMKIGEKFCSFEHYKARIKEHERVTRTKFSLYDTKLLTWFKQPGRNSARVAHANPELKYYSLTASCIRGRNYRRKPVNKQKIRNKPSLKMGCPAFFLLRMTPDGQFLQIVKMVKEHTHPVGQELKPKNGETILKCQMNRCKGQAVEDDNEEISVVVPHNHDASEESQKLKACLKKMEERAISEAIPVEQIFAEEAEKNPDVITRKSEGFVVKTLTKKRTQTEPHMPESLLSLSKLLVSDKYRFRYGCNMEEFPRELFIGCIKARDNEVAVIFASLFLCERFNGPVDEMHIDCSFNDFPEVPSDMKYMFSIHFVKKKMFYPSIYAFTSSRSSSMIQGILMYLQQEVIQNAAPDTIYVDLKWNITSVLSERFPGSFIEHSYLYFVKDVWNQAREIGLLGLPEQEHVVCCIQQLICLPFLPADHMLPVLIEFEKCLPEDMISSPVFVLLIRYIQDYWLDVYGEHKLTIHENHNRSNLLVNQFHKKISSAFSVDKQPSVWSIIKALQRIERDGSKCYNNEINNFPINSTTLMNMCQMAYDERVTKLEHEILTEQNLPINALEPLSRRPVILGLTPEESKSFVAVNLEVAEVVVEETVSDQQKVTRD
ncbi:uncharacterized protein LOC132201174 isoform X2 [Neocloeon triangulifer]|uniref:uncharacterized protein LOC132201174 isoform X2 n=1 Tax=Neocloeon triangulifer TaxID=2078957 RepID=UPI00286F014C|nr:uncharacterized protein LOC132201174 isoform X2 [Neocloeon triangulifer]